MRGARPRPEKGNETETETPRRSVVRQRPKGQDRYQKKDRRNVKRGERPRRKGGGYQYQKEGSKTETEREGSEIDIRRGEVRPRPRPRGRARGGSELV